MPNSLKVLTLIVAIGVAALFVGLYGGDEQIPGIGDVSAPESAAKTESALAVRHITQKDGGAEPVDGESGCLTEAQLQTHPSLTQDAYRHYSVATNGPDIAAFRGLTRETLLSMAAQGDSAAMTVLGEMASMRIRGISEDRAVASLQLEDPELRSYRIVKPTEQSVREDYEDAAYWFYRSALHGRLFALQKYGQVQDILAGGAVGMGWIEKQDYEKLNNAERNFLSVSNVYHALVFDIAPQLADGIFGFTADMALRSPLHDPIRQDLLRQFNADLAAADLPPIEIAEATSPGLYELMGMLCESEIREKKRRKDAGID